MAYRLNCERLEARDVPSATPLADAPAPLVFHRGPIVADLTGDGLDDLVTRDLQGRILLRAGLPDGRFTLPDAIGPAADALALADGRLVAWTEDGMFALDRDMAGVFYSSRFDGPAEFGHNAAVIGPGWSAELDPETHLLHVQSGDALPRQSLDLGPDAVGVTMTPLGPLVGTASGDVWRLADDGTGALQPKRITGLSLAAAADLDNDGRADVVYKPMPDDQLWVRTTDGRRTPIDVAGRIDALHLADLDGDGQADLVVCDAANSRVLIYPGLGGGEFGPEVNGGEGFSVAPGPSFATSARLTGGPVLDLVVVSTDSDQVSILLGVRTPAGLSMLAGDRIKVGVRPTSAALADLNGDSLPDLVVTSGGDDTIKILPGAGGGHFDPDASRSLEAGHLPYRVALGDFDGDGKTDAVSLNAGSNDLTFHPDAANASGPGLRIDAGGLGPAAASVEDVNGDGIDDLVVSTYVDGHVTLLLGGPSGPTPMLTLLPAAGPTGSASADETLWMTSDKSMWSAVLGHDREPTPTEPRTAAPSEPNEGGAELDFQPIDPGGVPLVPLWMGGTSALRRDGDGTPLLPAGLGGDVDGLTGKLKPGGRGLRDAETPEDPPAKDEQAPLNRFLLGADEFVAPDVSADGSSEQPAAPPEPAPAPMGQPVARAEREDEQEAPRGEDQLTRAVGAAVLLAAWIPWWPSSRRFRLPTPRPRP